MRELLQICGGYVYDPTNGIDGRVHDIWIEHGKIVQPPGSGEAANTRTINAAGMVVMPGGIDMHCHIAGPKVNAARKMRPEDRSGDDVAIAPTPITHSGTMGSVPSTFATGYKYAGLGYTTAFDAAVPPLAARHAHEEFEDTPCIDKGFYVLMGNNHFVMKSIPGHEPERLTGVRRLAAGRRQGLRRQAGQSGRRRGLEAPRRPATLADSTRRSTISTSRRGRSSAKWPARSTTCDCRTRSTSTATTWACPATGTRRSRR